MCQSSKKIKDFHNNLNVKRITGNRKFWQTIKLNFIEMTFKDERTTLVDGDVIKEEKNSNIILKKL